MKDFTFYQGGNALAYAEFGEPNGYPVLIQHGMIASIDDGEGLFRRLIHAGARLISIARPGYGDSSPYLMRNVAEWGDMVAVLVDELGLPQFDVFGISSGAPYAYAIGQRFPDRARNLFILSGIPALYDERVQALWPYPVNKNATIPEMQTLAYDLFFARLAKEDLEKADIKDSMRNDCCGPAQDLRIRAMDWGFTLADVKPKVYMRHSTADIFAAAELTARLLPNCEFEARENDVHFSQDVLDDFIETVIAAHIGK